MGAPMVMPEVAMARLLDDEVDPPVRDRVRWASAVYDQVEQLKARVAELEQEATGTFYAVRWPAGEIEEHRNRADAENVVEQYRYEGAELVQAKRGPWTAVS